MNVTSVETTLPSLPAPSLNAGISLSSLTASLTGSNPAASELGAFLALFNGFVASSATSETAGTLELPLPEDPKSAQPRSAKDPKKSTDQPKEKLPDLSATSLAQTGLDLAKVLTAQPVIVVAAAVASPGNAVEPSLPPDTAKTTSAEIAAAAPRIDPALSEAPVAFALRLTDRTGPIAPQPVESGHGNAKATPSVHYRDVSFEAPAAEATNLNSGSEPVDDVPRPQKTPAVTEMPAKELSMHRPPVTIAAPADPEASPVRIADPSEKVQQPDLPDPRTAAPVSQPVETRKIPDTPPTVPADRITSDDAQVEQNSVQPTHSPAQERVISPRSQQHSTQQDTGNGEQPSSKDSKDQGADRRSAMPERNQNSTPINAIHFASQIRTPAETAGPFRVAGDSHLSAIIAPDADINPATSTQPTRQISLRLEGADAQKVAIQLTERAGRVQVAVRTADGGLAKSLQGDLGDLVGRLENKGFKTEAWVPAAARHATAVVFESGNPANSQGQPGNSGAGTGGQQDQQRHNGSNQRQHPRWAAQLEESLDETGKEKQ